MEDRPAPKTLNDLAPGQQLVVDTGNVAGFANHTLDEALEQSDYAVITLMHDPFKAAKEKIAAKPHFDCVGLLEQ